MNTEELDALDALLRSTRFGPVEVVDVTEIWRISATSEDVVCDCAESKDADFIAALVNAAPRLLAEAREVAQLRLRRPRDCGTGGGAMSEVITKACPAKDCDDGLVRDGGATFRCKTCSGLGLVPDVEATLRADVARLTNLVEDGARTMTTMAERIQWLTEQNNAVGEVLKATAGDVVRFHEENTRLTAEVERLSQREPTQQECDEAEGKPDATGKTWPAGEVFLGTTCRRCIDCGRWAFGGPTRCPYCAGKYDVTVTGQMYIDDLRAANAEVERLKGRDQAAKPFVMACKEPGEFDQFCGSCWRFWSEDGSGCAEDCPRAAWLAGCKS